MLLLYISVACVFLKGDVKDGMWMSKWINECQISLFLLQRPPVLLSVALRWSTGLFQRTLSTNWVVVQVETLPGMRGTDAKQQVVERSNYCSSLELKDCRWDQEGNIYQTQSQSIWIWAYTEHEKDPQSFSSDWIIIIKKQNQAVYYIFPVSASNYFILYHLIKYQNQSSFKLLPVHFHMML